MATYPTPALQRAYVSAPVDEHIIATLELSHSAFTPNKFYLNDSPTAITATIEGGSTVTFTPFPFQFKLPVSDNQGAQELLITLANAGQDLVTQIEAASRKPQERIDIVLRIYLSSDLTAPQALPLRLTVDNLSMNDQAIVATANRADVLNFPFPSIGFTPEAFPGLKR
jgi:hypothetical protein